jgi:Zn-dependent M32 family carboxypeptidase
MAKLTKQEVNALAAKACREISKRRDESRNELLKNYVPSANYKKMQKLLEDILYRNKEIAKLQKENAELYNKFYDLYDKITGSKVCYMSISNYSDVDTILHRIKEREIGVAPYPVIDEIKEEIIISSIDEEFDATECINKIISLYE